MNNILEGEKSELAISMLQDPMEEMVSIIVIHKDRPEYLNITLQSIAIASLNNNYELIVVDNASTHKDAIDFLEDLNEQGDVKVIRNNDNLYWSKAANQGAKAADKRSKYLIFVHHDVVVLNSAWIDMLLNVSETADAGLVGLSMSSYSLDKQKIDFIEEYCMLVTRECYNDCGPFCEELVIGPAFLFTLAAQFMNHRPQVLNNGNIVHHYGVFSFDSSSFERFSEESLAILPNKLRDLQLKTRRR